MNAATRAATSVAGWPPSVVVRQMPPDVDKVERTRALGQQVRALQLGHRLRKRIAGAEDDAAAPAELAEQRRQRDRRPDTAAAVAAAFEPVARRHDQRIRLRQPARE